MIIPISHITRTRVESYMSINLTLPPLIFSLSFVLPSKVSRKCFKSSSFPMPLPSQFSKILELSNPQKPRSHFRLTRTFWSATSALESAVHNCGAATRYAKDIILRDLCTTRSCRARAHAKSLPARTIVSRSRSRSLEDWFQSG